VSGVFSNDVGTGGPNGNHDLDRGRALGLKAGFDLGEVAGGIGKRDAIADGFDGWIHGKGERE
jgi:hypothetical protein